MQYEFDLACSKCDLNRAKLLYAAHDVFTGTSLELACVDAGHIPLIKWLIKTVGVDVHENEDYAFGCLCLKGHLRTAKWLMKEVPQIDVHAVKNGALRLACRSGHLKVAKWIICNWPSPKLHYGYTTLTSVCWRKHFNIAKWIMRLWPVGFHIEALEDLNLNIFKSQRALQLVSFFCKTLN